MTGNCCTHLWPAVTLFGVRKCDRKEGSTWKFYLKNEICRQQPIMSTTQHTPTPISSKDDLRAFDKHSLQELLGALGGKVSGTKEELVHRLWYYADKNGLTAGSTNPKPTTRPDLPLLPCKFTASFAASFAHLPHLRMCSAIRGFEERWNSQEEEEWLTQQHHCRSQAACGISEIENERVMTMMKKERKKSQRPVRVFVRVWVATISLLVYALCVPLFRIVLRMCWEWLAESPSNLFSFGGLHETKKSSVWLRQSIIIFVFITAAVFTGLDAPWSIPPILVFHELCRKTYCNSITLAVTVSPEEERWIRQFHKFLPL